MTENEFLHWAEVIADRAIQKFGTGQVVCSGWSPSGVYHIGNSREAVTCNAIHTLLTNKGADSTFVFVIDDFDPLDKIPYDLKKYSTDLRPYLGHPINRVPDFTGNTDSYAQYFAGGAIRAMEDFEFDVTFVYASEMYREGKYDKYLKTYLNHEERIQNLFEGISGSPLDSFISVICQNCGNAKTTKIQRIGENGLIQYNCEHNKRFRGCGHQGEIQLESHEWKLKWRLDWPARQTFLNVTVEPSGKDHSVAGGSVDTALAIHTNIFEHQTPILERYGFITLGGQKFSGSRGGALAAEDISDIMPTSAYLYLVYRSDLLKDINFNPESMEYASLIDEFDTARLMVMGQDIEGREREKEKLSSAADLAMSSDERGFKPANVRFAELALVYQTSLFDKDMTINKLDDMEKFPSDKSKEETEKRLDLIKTWLKKFAPNSIKFELLDLPPDDISNYWKDDITAIWKEALNQINPETTPDEFTTKLREIASNYEVGPRGYYPPFYRLLTGKPRGPNAANLALALGKKEILDRINKLD